LIKAQDIFLMLMFKHIIAVTILKEV